MKLIKWKKDMKSKFVSSFGVFGLEIECHFAKLLSTFHFFVLFTQLLSLSAWTIFLTPFHLKFQEHLTPIHQSFQGFPFYFYLLLYYFYFFFLFSFNSLLMFTSFEVLKSKHQILLCFLRPFLFLCYPIRPIVVCLFKSFYIIFF